MTHLGILLAAMHYPDVSADPADLDGQFRRYLASLGHVPGRITVRACHAGEPPQAAADCWILSGSPWLWDAGADDYERLLDHIRRASGRGEPVYGLNHGEEVLEAALCPARVRRNAHSLPSSIRNPFRSFWMRDRLYALQDGALAVLPRPRDCNPRDRLVA